MPIAMPSCLLPVATFSADIRLCCAPQPRDAALIRQLTQVWESAVRATHHFLTEADIEHIRAMVPQALADVPHLYLALHKELGPVGFMGIAGTKLEMLFLHADMRGKGLGKALVVCGIERHNINEVVVNEANPAARGFYEHLGFQVTGRSSLDEQGNAWPIFFLARS